MFKLRPYEIRELQGLLCDIENGATLCLTHGMAGEDFEPLMHELIVCCISNVVADNIEAQED